MEDGNEMKGGDQQQKKFDFYSKVVRAGRRTYFFDMKATLESEFYITITESKRCFKENGRPFYEKHKIFLYPEDFEEFVKGLNQTTNFIRNNASRLKADLMAIESATSRFAEFKKSMEEIDGNSETFRSYSNADIEFEDLGNK